MSAAAIAEPISTTPAIMTPRQHAAVERCAALAIKHGLRVIGAGHCRAGEFAGCRCWAVSSASVPGLCRIVWCFNGRLLCSCPARRSPHVETCSHAQAVRLRFLAESGAIQPKSVPASAPAPAAERRYCANVPWCGYELRPDERTASRGFCERCAYLEPRPSTAVPPSNGGPVVPLCSMCGMRDIRACSAGACPYRISVGLPMPVGEAVEAPEPKPTPVAPAPVVCPSCGLAADPRELAELGECLACLLPAPLAGTHQCRACGAAVPRKEIKDPRCLCPACAAAEDDDPDPNPDPEPPAPAVAVVAVEEEQPEQEPTPAPAVPAAAVYEPVPHCPQCCRAADPDELAQLGKCAACLALDPVRCPCSGLATGETKDGVFCDACLTQRAERIRSRLAEAKKTAAGAIIARETARQKRYRTNGRADDPRPAQAKAEAQERKSSRQGRHPGDAREAVGPDGTATRKRTGKTTKTTDQPAPKHETAPPAARLDNRPVTMWK